MSETNQECSELESKDTFDACNGSGENREMDLVEEESSGDDDEPIINLLEQVDCLFCSDNFQSIENAIEHCYYDHHFDLHVYKYKLKMDCYSYIKMVNYLRSLKPSTVEFINILETATDDNLWQDEKYLMPVIKDDPWLQFDFDDLDEIYCGKSLVFSGKSSTVSGDVVRSIGNPEQPVSLGKGQVNISEKHFSELQRDMNSFHSIIEEKNKLIKEYKDAVTKMRSTLRHFVDTVDVDPKARCVASLNIGCDENYFGSYSHFDIHHVMLSDKVRTLKYKEAINLCAVGKQVLDLGCGTGILSMFAASAGAQSVLAIDQSDIAYHAMDIINENKLENRIKVLKGRIENIELPTEYDNFDIIVSEWMGYFLLFEGMLDSVIYARNKYLKPGGILLPNRCRIFMTGFSLPEKHHKLIGFWDDVYGYKMSCMKSEVIREPTVSLADKKGAITDSKEVLSLDLMTATIDSVNFTADFELIVNHDADLTCLVGYFDVFFDLSQTIYFSTGPDNEPTHWKQTIFLFNEPIPVKKDEVLPCKIVCLRHPKEVRSLTVTLIVKGIKKVFMML